MHQYECISLFQNNMNVCIRKVGSYMLSLTIGNNIKYEKWFFGSPEK